MSHVPYFNAVDSLIYVMVCTRPDLSHAVSVVIHYMHNPRMDHWIAVKWILMYVKGSIDKVLMFDGNKVAPLDVTGRPGKTDPNRMNRTERPKTRPEPI